MDSEKKEIDYNYENFDGTHVQSSEPKSKQFQTPQGPQNYHETPLLYNYGTSTCPIVDQCYIEFPPVITKGGIQYQKEEKKSTKSVKPGEDTYLKESYSMMFIFDLQDSDIAKFLGKMDDLHRGVAQSLVPWKAKIGLRHLDPKNPEATGLKNPVFYKVNQLTNERVAGQNPSLWVKLNHWKTNKTLFTDLDNNPVDWNLLTDVEAKMIPLVHVRQVYSGTSNTIQFHLVSAVILDIAAMNTRSKQVNTVEKLKEKYSGLANKVSGQLAQLRMEKQDSLDQHPAGPAKLPDNETGQFHQASVGKSAGSFENNNVDQLNAFLGAAPVQHPTRSHSAIQQSTLPGTVPQVSLPTQVPVQTVQSQPAQGYLQPPTMNPSGMNQPVQFGANVTHPMLQIQ